jgi:hypothetical protein
MANASNKTERLKEMITRNDFIEKLSKWLTLETCNALADYAESHSCGEKNCYERVLISMGEFTDDAEGLQYFIEYLIKADVAAGDKIEKMAGDMVYEW